MRIVNKIADILNIRDSINVPVGFVPTMGALHKGHLSLIRRSVKETKITVVSIFVNPKQFGPKEDLARYPRPWDEDCRLLRENGVKILFAPTEKAMYPSGYATHVTVSGLTETLCGSPSSRGPEHFRGVATVVAKLLNLVRPHRAYFGVKDFQQLRVIEQMNQDLHLGAQIVRCPTVREKDGLAMSSRNTYLSAEERTVAPQFYQALQYGRKLLRSNPNAKPQEVCEKVRSRLASVPLVRVEYVELVDPITLKRLENASHSMLIAGAIHLGPTRLIDNILFKN